MCEIEIKCLACSLANVLEEKWKYQARTMSKIRPFKAPNKYLSTCIE